MKAHEELRFKKNPNVFFLGGSTDIIIEDDYHVQPYITKLTDGEI